MIVVNTNHLKDLDELQRKVTLDAMGITLGVTFVVGIPWSLLDAYDVITFDAKFEHLFILMALTFLASVFSNMRSYR